MKILLTSDTLESQFRIVRFTLHLLQIQSLIDVAPMLIFSTSEAHEHHSRHCIRGRSHNEHVPPLVNRILHIPIKTLKYYAVIPSSQCNRCKNSPVRW